VDTSVNGQSQPLVVRLNSQAGPDTQQQAVDPLGLPSFSLPQGKGGLFRVITQPGHRYLVETDPQFASLKNFLNSDYMLSRLGYEPDAMQKRLGDGLYEQRLIRDAMVIPPYLTLAKSRG
jgi:filamentous hemagglutinin